MRAEVIYLLRRSSPQISLQQMSLERCFRHTHFILLDVRIVSALQKNTRKKAASEKKITTLKKTAVPAESLLSKYLGQSAKN